MMEEIPPLTGWLLRFFNTSDNQYDYGDQPSDRIRKYESAPIIKATTPVIKTTRVHFILFFISFEKMT
jgi:hypothetical protein